MQRRLRLLTTSVAVLAFPVLLRAQSLTWRDGISSVWYPSSTTTNLFSWQRQDGSISKWVEGSEAIFAGSGGTISGGTSFANAPTASALTFNAPGYNIASVIKAATATLTVTTNAAATLSQTIYITNTAGDHAVLVKQGTEALTVTGNLQTSGSSYIDVRKGELIFSGNFIGSLHTTLADDPSAILTLATANDYVNFSNLGSLTPNGGIIRPNNTARTLTVNLSSPITEGEFAGSLQDNGAGQLALSVYGSPVFTNENTYSGATSAYLNTPILLKGRGRFTNTPVISLNTRASLTLDNSTQAISSRLKAAVSLNLAGNFSLKGNATAEVSESIGTLTSSFNSIVQVDQPGTALTTLSIGQLAFNEAGTVRFMGNGQILWGGAPGDSTTINNVRVTYGDEWATVTNDGKIGPQTNFTSDLNAATVTSRVKIQDGNQSLAAPLTVESLRLRSDATVATLALGSQVLTLNSGGILSTGSLGANISGGTLQTSASQWVINTRSNLDISAVLSENTPATGLLKVGSGILSLGGNNSFSGRIILNEGTLNINSEANLGTANTIFFAGGKLAAASSLTLTKALDGQNFNSAILLDTAGNDVNLLGAIIGDLTRTGTGRLTIANPSSSKITNNSGELVLPNGSSGAISLSDGVLTATGTLTSLSLFGNAASKKIIDIGGAGTAALQTNSISLSTAGTTTIKFTLGDGGIDQWNLNGTSLATGTLATPLYFDFIPLGEVLLGNDYSLLSNVGSTKASNYALSPANTAAGWQGTFKFENSTLKVSFSSVPEPDTAWLGAMGLGIVAGWRRRTVQR